MDEIIRMDRGTARRVKAMVRRQCANYDGGNCLLLDNGETAPCPQLITSSLICKYFRSAVLPDDAALYIALIPPSVGTVLRCRDCGQLFAAPKHNTLYCPVCAANRARQSKREWAKTSRAGL